MEGVKQIVGKDSRFKLFWSGNDKGTGGVGVLLVEEWWEKVFGVVRVSNRIILIRMTIGKTVFVFVCVYAPQATLNEFEKDRFYQILQCAVSKIPASEQLIACGDWNGHIGSQSTGFEEVHGGQAIGKRNTEGERILEFAFANELVVGNRCLKKKPESGTHGSRRNQNTCHLPVWECCYPDRLHPVPAEFQETGVLRKDHIWGGVCITT